MSRAGIEFTARPGAWVKHCVELQFDVKYQSLIGFVGFFEFRLPNAPDARGLEVEFTDWYAGGCPLVYPR